MITAIASSGAIPGIGLPHAYASRTGRTETKRADDGKARIDGPADDCRVTFSVYNAMRNQLVIPHCGRGSRPEFIGTRRNLQPVQSQQGDLFVA